MWHSPHTLYDSSVQFEETSDKLLVITATIISIVSEMCGCLLDEAIISNEEFSCTIEPKEVLFRAVLSGSEDEECTEVLSYIHQWLETGTASISILGNRVMVSPNCAVEIESFDDPPDCSTQPATTTLPLGTQVTTSTSLKMVTSTPQKASSSGEEPDITLLIGTATGGTVVLVSIFIVIVLIVSIHRQRKKKKRYKNLT